MTQLETTLFNVTLSSFAQAQEMLQRINAYTATMGQLCELSPSAEPISLEQLEVIFKDMAQTSANAADLIRNAVEGIHVYLEQDDTDSYDSDSDSDYVDVYDVVPAQSSLADDAETVIDDAPLTELQQQLVSAGYIYLPDFKLFRMTETGHSNGNRRYLIPADAIKKDDETLMSFFKRVGICLDDRNDSTD